MAAILGDRVGRMAISPQIMRGILDSIATRLDEARELAREAADLFGRIGSPHAEAARALEADLAAGRPARGRHRSGRGPSDV